MQRRVAQRITLGVNFRGLKEFGTVQTLETAATEEGAAWEPGELTLTVSDEVLFGTSVVTQ